MEEEKEKKEALPTQPQKEESLKDLIEKNLKWSQIIYEQNRKINNKLLWAAIGSWIRVLLILVPLIIGFLYLPPLLKGVLQQYESLLGGGSSTSSGNKLDIDNLLKIYGGLDPAKQEQLKALIK